MGDKRSMCVCVRAGVKIEVTVGLEPARLRTLGKYGSCCPLLLLPSICHPLTNMEETKCICHKHPDEGSD